MWKLEGLQQLDRPSVLLIGADAAEGISKIVIDVWTIILNLQVIWLNEKNELHFFLEFDT